ncbi:MAG: translation elongation factor Ts [Ignavibacteriaceae bacterium]|jgi:elongation factor Ts|nr:translation elongation factor Ts [Ignavibacteriaceae bacterium]
MAITSSQVKELRDKTGAGMMDCKKALEESNGDFEKAIDTLRKKGAAVAAKRAERSANEGIILTKIFNDGKEAVMVEVNCETDFVAKSEDFLSFANLALESIIANKPNTIEELMNTTYDGKNLNSELTAIVGKIGEKIEVSRFAYEKTESGVIVDYIHHGSKLGVLVKADNVPSEKKDEFAEVTKDIAMQIAAMKPMFMFREEFPRELLDKEIEIAKELLRKEGKPEHMLDKISEGKLNKFFEENCLVDQVFVKDNSKKIHNLIEDFNKKNSAEAKLVLFKRFHLSDEKK